MELIKDYDFKVIKTHAEEFINDILQHPDWEIFQIIEDQNMTIYLTSPKYYNVILRKRKK